MNINRCKKLLAIFSTIFVLNVAFSTIVTAKPLTRVVKKGDVHPKVESRLLELENEYEKGAIAGQVFARRWNIKIEDPKNITVYMISVPGTTINEMLLQPYGAKIIKSTDNVSKIKAPINMLKAIADNVKEVSFIRLPDKPIPLIVESEGVNLTSVSLYHSEGYTGADVKVAVIDIGFADLSAAISEGEIPNSVEMVDCTGSSCQTTDFSSETDKHGTAVAEIVNDMAPDAQLYLIKIADTLDLVDAKNYAVSNGIKIINTSFGFFNTNFYDGKCWYSNAVCAANDAYDNDILWVTAAGNSALYHHEATFTDADSDGWHDVFGNDETLDISAYSGDTIVMYLTWDAWPTTDQDYDLYLYDSALNLVAWSDDLQTGTQQPIETIGYSVPVSGTYFLAIRQYGATTDHALEIYSAYHELTPSTASSSLSSPADAENVMAVGAIDQVNWTTGPQENYSSQGSTNDGRTKPEICGLDNVSNYVYDLFPGTSAASPHVAGAAALILCQNPTYTGLQIWNDLVSLAIDMGSDGQDNLYGYGRLNLNDCPDDPNKPNPGVCGCGVADTDTDGDGTPDCNDDCPDDPNKVNPGTCGCGVADTDTDGDGTPDCNDNCPDDLNKVEPGTCGCGVADTNSDGDVIPDCNDNCPDDSNKVEPGTCGCGVADTDTDGDGTLDCNDNCPDDSNKVDPGTCGCGVADTDTDGDGISDCGTGDGGDGNTGGSGGSGCFITTTIFGYSL